MSASLVGSEMCIRDSPGGPGLKIDDSFGLRPGRGELRQASAKPAGPGLCLLYTSDAADDM
eukprot:8342874-Alexandrium_andersonii.AAC.1